MARIWRLLVDGSASGPFNMGVDEALLDTALRDGQPSLRFYLWRGPWLSLGYGQHPNAEGDATAHYISQRLNDMGVRLTRIAYGMPLGGDLEYADHITVGRSMENRRSFD